jgi:uncharacterized membrane protein
MALAVVGFALAGLASHIRVARALPGREDVLYAWQSGKALAEGNDPYSRIHASDLRTRQHPATYFPFYYLAAAAAYRLGVHEYPDWLKIWRPVCELSNVVIALFLLIVLSRWSLPLGLFGSGFWFFNRWTITVVNMAHLDIPALVFLVLSIYFFEKRRTLSFLLFGASLSVKQVALFVFPLYLLWVCIDAGKGNAVRQLLRAGLLISAIPLTLVLPFLVWDASGFCKSILFSASRLPAGDFNAKSIDAALGLVGLPAKVPMLTLMGLVVASAAGRRLSRYAAVLLVLSVFIDFNSVLFAQYMVWMVPFLPLTAATLQPDVRPASSTEGPEPLATANGS